ncbi:hypothetical protein [Streptomyces sp. NPDC002580]|uniref:hypothetical protein n=1 Tax=Streptomyces sp. NPDC002580 TaxID=3364653 RepID=UPI0036BC7C67
MANTVTGLAVGALLLGAAACTGGGDGGDEKDRKAVPCAHGTYAWSRVTREQKLTGLADPITLKKKTDSVSVPIKPVKGVGYKPHVTATGLGVRAADAIKALGRHLGTEEPLADPSESKVPEETSNTFEAHTGDLKGSYYAWRSVALVEADFTYTCSDHGPEPVKGHAVTWETVGGGFLTCDDPVHEEDPSRPDAAMRTAARENCPPGSRAAKSA